MAPQPPKRTHRAKTTTLPPWLREAFDAWSARQPKGRGTFTRFVVQCYLAAQGNHQQLRQRVRGDIFTIQVNCELLGRVVRLPADVEALAQVRRAAENVRAALAAPAA